MNIVWKRTDGGVSVTHMTPEGIAAMERGVSLAPLAAERDEINADRDAAVIELNRLNGLIAPDEETDPATASAMDAASNVIALADDALAKIAEYDTIVENVGLSLSDHAALIQARALNDWNKALASDPSVPRPDVLDWIMVAEDIEMPTTREWRNAWTWMTDDPVIDICPVRAAALTKDRLRRERAPLMAALDVAYMRALEAGDTTAVVAEKDRLRNITAEVDAVAPGDLAALSALSC